MERWGNLVGMGELVDRAFEIFLRDLDACEEKRLRSLREDEFLDAYSVWLKTKKAAAKAEVLKAARALSRLDRHFQFLFPGND